MGEVAEIEIDEVSEAMESIDPRKINADYELIPPKDSEGVGKAVADMLSKILTYREDMEFSERCVRYYKLRRNEHWKYENKSLNLLSANLLGSHHQKTVNMLTDNNPTFNAIPGGDLGDEAQDKLSLLVNVTDSWWNETEQQSAFEESCDIGELYGTVGEHLYFDKEDNFPAGEINTKTIDPMYISLYPPKCRKIKDAEAVLTWEPMTLHAARREWKDVADQLVSDVSLIQDIGDTRNDDTDTGKKSSQTLISSVLKWVTSGSKAADDSDELFVITAWVKDHSEYEDGTPVYPGGLRRVRVTNGGETVLDDEYNPSLHPDMPEEFKQANYLYSNFPYSYTQPVVDPVSPFGRADFEQLEKLNVEFNKTMTQFALFKDKTARPKFSNPRDSGVKNSDLDNSTGIVNPTNHLVAQAMKYIDPPAMNADIMTGLNLYKDLFNEVAGSFNDVMQGQKHGSEVIAAKAIAMLLEEASRMARGKIRNYSKMLRQRGRMFIALAQSWYDTPRFIAFQKNGREQTVSVDRNALQIAGKIDVVNGSTMPVSNIQRREEVLSLAHGGFVDQEYVLDKFNVDNARDIIQRMQQGPIGQYIQRLAIIGIPQPILQLFQQIGQMDEQQVEKAVKEGKIPQFQQIMQQMSGQQPPPNPEDAKNQIEAQKLQLEGQKIQIDSQKVQADIQKIIAEAELVKQKIETEVTERQIKMIGVDLDKQNLTIEKAKALSAIESAKKADQRLDRVDRIEKIKTAAGLHKQKIDEMRQDKGGYDERGMKSNNQDITV